VERVIVGEAAGVGVVLGLPVSGVAAGRVFDGDISMSGVGVTLGEGRGVAVGEGVGVGVRRFAFVLRFVLMLAGIEPPAFILKLKLLSIP
jgi:hypothetical protein